MYRSFRRWTGLPVLLAVVTGLVVAPASADTTVAEYIKLEKRGQAHVLGSLLQSLAEDLQAHNRDREAECLQALYTANSEARAVQPLGMADFFQSVELARESDPEKTTVEQIIARQLVEYCGTPLKN